MTEFCSDYVLINDKGIDLLRSRFPYHHINFSDIHSSKIYTGYLLQNRFIPLVAGISFIVLSLKLLSPGIEIFKEIPNSSAHFYGRGVAMMLIIPLTLIGLGSYFIVQALKKSKILMILTESGLYNIRIKEFEEADKIYDLVVFLNKKLPRNVENVI